MLFLDIRRFGRLARMGGRALSLHLLRRYGRGQTAQQRVDDIFYIFSSSTFLLFSSFFFLYSTLVCYLLNFSLDFISLIHHVYRMHPFLLLLSACSSSYFHISLILLFLFYLYRFLFFPLTLGIDR